MKYVLVFRPEVGDDLRDAYDWYESQQAGLGDEFIDCVDDLLNQIGMMPESYAIVYLDIRRAVIIMAIANLTTPMHPTIEVIG